MENTFSEVCEALESERVPRPFGKVYPPGTVNLTIGEPDLDIPPSIKHGCIRAVEEGKNKYVNPLGIPELREKIAKRYSKYGDYRTDNVLITMGATQGLFLSMYALLRKNDEVLIPDPGFVIYPVQAIMCGGKVVRYRMLEEEEWRPDIDDIYKKMSRKTKAIVVNSPSNPMSSVIKKKDIDEIKSICGRNVYIISDEVYDEFVFDGEHASFLDGEDKSICINSISKSMCATGWRLGYVVGNKEVISKMAMLNYYIITCPPSVTQYGAIEGFDDKEYFRELRETFRKRCDDAWDLLKKIKGFSCVKPRGAMYLFPRYEYNMSSYEMANFLLKKGVAVLPGRLFGENGERHIRISLGAPGYAEGLKRMSEAVESLS